MNNNLPWWYDSWKIDNGESDTCQCYYCEKEFPNKDIEEDSRRNNICKSCAEEHEVCSRCDVVIVDSDYGHDELCDSCVDIAVDRRESYKGETY